MQNWRSVSDVITAEHMIRKLAGMCNGASSWDGAGFSKTDVQFGHSLAAQAAQGRAWSMKQASAALKMITQLCLPAPGTWWGSRSPHAQERSSAGCV